MQYKPLKHRGYLMGLVRLSWAKIAPPLRHVLEEWLVVDSANGDIVEGYTINSIVSASNTSNKGRMWHSYSCNITYFLDHSPMISFP